MRVAVYGTLKHGGRLAGNMKAIKAKFIKETIIKGFSMFNMGWFPAIIKEEGSEIHAEVYEVDDNGLNVLDAVEGYPSLYQRMKTDEGFIYYMDNASKVIGMRRIKDGNWKVNKNN